MNDYGNADWLGWPQHDHDGFRFFLNKLLSAYIAFAISTGQNATEPPYGQG